MRPSRVPSILGVVAITAVAGGAAAEPLVSRVGVAVTVGGGVERSVSAGTRESVGPASVWEVRAAIATRLLISPELAYIGSTSMIERDGGRGTLLGTGIEALIRINLSGLGPLRPYVFTGRALRRYSVRGAARARSPGAMYGLADHDTDVVVELPLGAGCAIGLGGRLVLDARVALRFTGDAELVVDPTSDDGTRYAAMHTWSATARVGYEF